MLVLTGNMVEQKVYIKANQIDDVKVSAPTFSGGIDGKIFIFMIS